MRKNLVATTVAIALATALSPGSMIPSAFAQLTAPGAAIVTPNRYGLPDFGDLVEQVGPAVVNISVVQQQQQPTINGQNPFANDPFYDFLRRFGVPMPGMPGQPGRGPRVRQGIGSGFIVSQDGYVLTNAHVVAGEEGDGADVALSEVTVTLIDKREFKAMVVGIDRRTDVALLKIDATKLPSVKIGRADDARVGEWVVAMGSPFGFDNTVTAGIISAKARRLPDETYVPFIQTDAAVNPGNSGGPLFNAAGEVVGINSQIYSRSGGFQGLSFAIPIEVATRVEQQIVATGHVEHARLGVAVQEVNQAFAESFNLDKPEGALVASVSKGSPAEKAGLQAGDVIRQVDGQPIVASGDLPAWVGQAQPGQQAKLSIWRQGKPLELTATLGDASDKAIKQARNDDAVGKGQLGLSLRPLDPQERRAAGLNEGLVIEQARGPAAAAGVQPGDVLLAINGAPIKDITQVRAAMAKAGKSVALLIERDGDKIFVPVRLG